MKPNFDSGQVPWIEGPAELFVIGTGEVSLSAEKLLPKQEVVQELYTSIGSDSEPLIAGIVQVREPAKGLDPEQYVSLLLAVDPETQEVIKTTEVASTGDEFRTPESLTGTDGPAVSFSISTGVSEDFEYADVYGYNALTGEQLWQSRASSMGEVIGAVVLESASEVTNDYGDPCARWAGTDIATGKQLYVVESADLSDPCENSSIIARFSGGGTPFLAEYGKFVRFSGTEAQTSFDGTLGQERFIPDVIFAADILSDLVAGRDTGRATETQAINVIDTVTGETIWSLDADRVADLGATVLALHDEKLYIKTTDQSPVIDVTTGETVEEDSSRYPLVTDGDWTYWSDGSIVEAG